MMANEEDYENVAFSDYHDFNSEYEKGKAVIDPNIGSNSDPLLKIDLSHPSKIPPPRPTPIPIPTPPPTIDSNLQPHRLFTQLNPFHSRGPKWFSETEISEEERYECSLYGEMLLDRYNQVKGTDFEFVRLVKKLESGAAGLNIKIQFNAKSSAAAECTLKTFEGFVFKYWNFHHRVFPMSCRLLRPDPLGYMVLVNWLRAQISEEERYEFSLYGEMLLDRYNQVKGTDFEFVRLVKMMVSLVAGLNYKIQFKAKSSAAAAAAECTLKTFEGFVLKYWNFRHRVWPQTCRLLRPDPPGYVYDEESRPPVCTYEVEGHPCLP
nr:hypothetical protein CFP56_76894 [Quercus suber]